MRKCPLCKKDLRAGKGVTVEKDGQRVRKIQLLCRTKGCPNNTGIPLMVDEVVMQNGT